MTIFLLKNDHSIYTKITIHFKQKWQFVLDKKDTFFYLKRTIFTKIKFFTHKYDYNFYSKTIVFYSKNDIIHSKKLRFYVSYPVNIQIYPPSSTYWKHF